MAAKRKGQQMRKFSEYTEAAEWAREIEAELEFCEFTGDEKVLRRFSNGTSYVELWARPERHHAHTANRSIPCEIKCYIVVLGKEGSTHDDILHPDSLDEAETEFEYQERLLVEK